MDDPTSVAALWGAVIFSGFYHGVNPGMGWPLAVSAALFEHRTAALLSALVALAIGHLLAMTAILLPFTMMIALVQWEAEIRIGAGVLVITLGVYLLWNRRHPRFLARVKPSKLGLWSFLAALAHGAGLMLVPIYLGICAIADTDAGHAAAGVLMASNFNIALAVAASHTLAMTVAGGALAAGMYFWLGLKFLSKSWFNLDVVWALSLILVGVIAVLSAK
ncbi:hypothetical protein [uncultured Roseobacter sp.]|uniref:hypothetical protein n=1 Tax=uncultured Roseobacter sp. TaxID=114847 RepID=UPI002605161E|nr:hypothetical protein [uncultured Roseobacter sp.]